MADTLMFFKFGQTNHNMLIIPEGKRLNLLKVCTDIPDTGYP